MTKYLMFLVLFITLFAQVPVNTGTFYWPYFLLWVYVLTFPNGPAQSIKKRIQNRAQQPRHSCTHCNQLISQQDLLCPACKLEISLGGHR